MFSKDQCASRAAVIYYRRNFSFLKGKFSNASNNFSCYIRPHLFQTAGLHPKFPGSAALSVVASAKSDVPAAPLRRVHFHATRCRKNFSSLIESRSEQFFRQHERNKPEPLARIRCPLFKIVTVLKHCGVKNNAHYEKSFRNSE